MLTLLSKILLVNVKSVILEKHLVGENKSIFGENTIEFKELVCFDEIIQGQNKGKLAMI